VDSGDMGICDNNYSVYASKMVPTGAPAVKSTKNKHIKLIYN